MNRINIIAMKKLILRSTQSLLQTLAFPGLSAEQSLLATIVCQNPATNNRVRKRARSLLLLNSGATSSEVSNSAAISRRSLGDLIQRFASGGLCAAILGDHASLENRTWLSLNPSSAPSVQLQRRPSSRRRQPDDSYGEHASDNTASSIRNTSAQPSGCHTSCRTSP